jgi:hypothetical protein
MKKLLIILSITLFCSAAANAAVLNVPSQYSTIQDGINAAVNGDTVLVADGTHSGIGNRGIQLLGKAIVVTSENGPHNCIIDCESVDRGFYMRGGETANTIINGFTIVGGNSAYGGAVRCRNSSPTFSDCIFDGNMSPNSYGGGFFISNCSPQIINCTFYMNNSRYGGTIYATNSDFVLKNSIFAWNFSTG